MSFKSTTEAAIHLGWSRELVVKLTERCPKSGEDRTLLTKDVDGTTYFAEADLDGYRDYLSSAWPKTKKASRPYLPEYIKDDVRAECHYQCAICGSMDNGEVAHIEAVKDALNNSPDNLILLCPNHHTEYDYGYTVSSNVTADVVRAAKKMKRSSRRRMLKFEAHTEAALRTVLSLVKKAEKLAASAEPDLCEVYTTEISRLLRGLPGLVQEAQADAGRDGELSSTQKVLAEKANALMKAASSAVTKSADEKTVRSAARSVLDISSQFLLDLDEVDCPHCHGAGQTGLVGDLCAYCKGSCVVTEEQAEDYDAGDLDEVDCPHCGGTGQTGLAGDICGFCKGSCVVSRAVADEYNVNDLDEMDCPHCHGSGQTGLAGDVCAYCRGSCKVTAERASEYDPEAIDEVECPRCRGSGQTGLVGDVCKLCKGQTVVRQAVLEVYEEKHGSR